ncbi:DUF5365 family protein [Metabacillus sediminilitoris]|uniref:Uncharacterized protein n=1 Tax=Metabacillus sediminilitoris TaxID=2567941 RepID=A0A4S4BXU5_9BACI|nr:DUF5365 family protein [Metabacillus sediminilitoris]QGQ44421.1 hypothetical protein GMB29_03605 [Metabacillus sediminilitoris]THF80044.1 hypothetical protein E6W99_10220 [Metabacillus sediminilitoris]
MKVVVASTEEQERHIDELVEQIYTEIFPKFFPDQEIKSLKGQKVLQPQAADQMYNGTLKDAFQIISSLQVVISVLNHIDHCKDERKYREMFERNSCHLNEYGYFFPFSFSQFKNAESQEGEFSQFIKPANDWVV